MEEDETLTEEGTTEEEAGETYGPQDAVILNYSQQAVVYKGIPKVWLTHPDSTEEAPVLVPYTYGEAVGKTVEPDFSEGDMAVPIAEGELVTELVIAKPEGLVPENIAEGEYIAGVGPGTHTGGELVEDKEKTVELDFHDYVVFDNDESMDMLLMDPDNARRYVKYMGETGEYVTGQVYQMVTTAEANSTSVATQVASGTELTASIECAVGDLIIAAFVIRSALVSLSDGWELISTSQSTTEINSSDTSNQTLSFAYKYATDTTESLTVTQTSAARIYINMVALSGATGFTDMGYQYQSNATAADATSATFTRPVGGFILWGLTRSQWSNSGFPVWEVSNNSRLIQLGATTQSRLLLAIDASGDENVTFSTSVTSTTDAYICGALSIEVPVGYCFVAVDVEPDIVDSQIIEAEAGTLMSRAIVQIPDTLVPENIVAGVDIAGIIGTFGYAGIEIYTVTKYLAITSASSKQSTITVLAASDLPDWWPAAGSMPAFYYGASNPVYIAMLVRKSGTGGQKYLQGAMLTNFTGYSIYNAYGGYFGAYSSSPARSGFSSVSSTQWNYTTPSSYSGLFQNTNGICLGSYNQYCQCAGTYMLVLLKVDPYS